VHYESIVICGIGNRRSENQDNFFLNGDIRSDPDSTELCRRYHYRDDNGVFAVADGMGGEAFGGLAAFIAVNRLSELAPVCSREQLRQHLLDRNGDICAEMNARGGVRIGTTFVGLSLTGENADIVSVGDSRVYVYSFGRLKRISRDDSVVQELIDSGCITEDEAMNHPDRNKITQHLGLFGDDPKLNLHFYSETVKDGDIFLLCSDGLTDMVSDSVMRRVFGLSENIDMISQALYNSAMRLGGRDNITIMLVKAKKD